MNAQKKPSRPSRNMWLASAAITPGSQNSISSPASQEWHRISDSTSPSFQISLTP